MLNSFSRPSGKFYIFVEEMSVKVLCLFFKWVTFFIIEQEECFRYTQGISLIKYMIFKYLLLFCVFAFFYFLNEIICRT
jgi:hypothetical protein